MRRSLSGLLIGLFISVQAVSAESSWWERGKDLLEGFAGSNDSAALTNTEIASGLREALRVGTGSVIRRLGKEDGYYRDPKAHIPLPEKLIRVRDTLARLGMSDMLDDLELRMNRAAEAAAPKARAMFIDAIQNMTLDDVRRIYRGTDDAATRYFQSQMSGPLAEEFTPVVNHSLAEAGAIRTYDKVMQDYGQIPFMPDIKANLSEHVVDHAIDAIFDYLADEEAAIRQNPAKQTTELLRRVFGT